MVDNSEWLDELEYIPFLRSIGRHFTINRMVAMDSVKLRLEREQPLTFLEFNYMILQAYDFTELYRRYGCRLQMGGSDQWGNIVVGIDLARRTDNAELFGLTSPLITTSSGAKMGKSVAGAVWLSADMLSPYDYWQYWRNVEDTDTGRFLRVFTDLPIGEIERLEALKGSEINEAKKVLANEATALAHGRAEAERAAGAAHQTFEGEGVSADLPTVTISRADLAKGIGVLALFTHSGLTTSNSEARRQIAGGGLKVNDQTVTDERASIGERDVAASGAIKLSLGRKKHVLVRPA
jgi:tyrosyl-tRNA synthetase